MITERAKEMARDFDRDALRQIQLELDKRADWLSVTPSEEEAIDSGRFRDLANSIAEFLADTREEV